MEQQNPHRKRPSPQFLFSAAYSREFKPLIGQEFAILGRSNVGKSSFLNHVLERQGLARTSRTPGKTSLANFYRIDESMVWVDLPGYGYARTSGSERERWSMLIRAYCEHRKNCSGIIWLVDIRHPGQKADLEAFQWLKGIGIPLFVLLTKGDKVTRRQAADQLHAAMNVFNLAEEPMVYSVMQHASRERFWERFALWRQRLQNASR